MGATICSISSFLKGAGCAASWPPARRGSAISAASKYGVTILNTRFILVPPLCCLEWVCGSCAVLLAPCGRRLKAGRIPGPRETGCRHAITDVVELPHVLRVELLLVGSVEGRRNE